MLSVRIGFQWIEFKSIDFQLDDDGLMVAGDSIVTEKFDFWYFDVDKMSDSPSGVVVDDDIVDDGTPGGVAVLCQLSICLLYVDYSEIMAFDEAQEFVSQDIYAMVTNEYSQSTVEISCDNYSEIC